MREFLELTAFNLIEMNPELANSVRESYSIAEATRAISAAGKTVAYEFLRGFDTTYLGRLISEIPENSFSNSNDGSAHSILRCLTNHRDDINLTSSGANLLMNLAVIGVLAELTDILFEKRVRTRVLRHVA